MQDDLCCPNKEGNSNVLVTVKNKTEKRCHVDCGWREPNGHLPMSSVSQQCRQQVPFSPLDHR